MGDVVIVELKGRIDIHANAELADELKRLVSENLDKYFLINLEHVEYISSSGLGVLVHIKRDLAIKNKTLLLAGMQPGVEKIFQVSGMKEHFNIFISQREALDSL